jgi:zinc transporter
VAPLPKQTHGLPDMPIEVQENDGLVFVRILDGDGGARSGTWDDVLRWQTACRIPPRIGGTGVTAIHSRTDLDPAQQAAHLKAVEEDTAHRRKPWSPADGVMWAHFNYANERACRWIREESGIEPLIAAALLEEKPRPRSLSHRNGLFMVLRAVNSNPGENLGDLVALRVWIEEHRIITVRQRAVRSVRDVREALELETGPCTSGDFVAEIAHRIMEHMESESGDLLDMIEEVEDHILDNPRRKAQVRINHIRKQVMALRRHLAPQRELLMHIVNERERLPWMSETNRLTLREAAEHAVRYVDDLDRARETVQAAQEELFNRVTEEVNNNTYVMSILTAVFLPLNLVTGMLGMNVDGIPEHDQPWAFFAVCGGLLLLTVFEIWILMKCGLLDWAELAFRYLRKGRQTEAAAQPHERHSGAGEG